MTSSIDDTPIGIDYDPDPESPTSIVEEVMLDHEEQLLQIPGVTGVGIGQNAVGNAAIIVYLESKCSAAKLPKQLNGFDVIVEVTGVIEAY